MSLCRSLSRFARGLVFGAAMFTAEASAQTCAAPAVLTVNTSTFIDTCLADTGLVFACGLTALTGPAAVVRLQLPYPVGQVSVQSFTFAYDPAMFLLRSYCDGFADCGMAVDSGVMIDTMNLADVDSGDYFLAIAPYDVNSIPCGQISVTYSMSPAELELALDGVFRGGISAPPANL